MENFGKSLCECNFDIIIQNSFGKISVNVKLILTLQSDILVYAVQNLVYMVESDFSVNSYQNGKCGVERVASLVRLVLM